MPRKYNNYTEEVDNHAKITLKDVEKDGETQVAVQFNLYNQLPEELAEEYRRELESLIKVLQDQDVIKGRPNRNNEVEE